MNQAFPESVPRSTELSVRVNGIEADVLCTNVAYFTSFEYSGEAQVEIVAADHIRAAKISPLSRMIPSQVESRTLRFKVSANEKLHIEMEGVSLPLFFYGNHESAYDGLATYYFKGGQVHEAGELELHDNESIYIESGAVVRGSIRANGAANIKIYGNGILDSSCFRDVPDYRTILLYDCTGVSIQDIIMLEPPCWMIMLAACRQVHINGIKQIGEVVSSDGVDIVGSQDVLIENCILRNNDDCVVIKAFDWADAGGSMFAASKNVYNVEIRSSIFVNARAGNAIEIGHELTTDEITGVCFHDIDIISVHGYGAAFSIHVGDRAAVHHIVFENIRVEHYYDKLVDFRVIKSKYFKDEQRGRIHDILLKDIFVHQSVHNPGYSISVIGGYDGDHRVERVTFDNFCLNHQKVTCANQLDLFTKEAEDITFK
ncbi:hypothetical protein FHS19_003508 [Paenibacillus rhizosphaerae]|uniref:Endopolygalacturonase n=1 Tax=Paenibacillus rhizosphaerae TaxID=297318 RepID=A0A839TQP0_9BACL|nr:glycosyl hydrolase family 28 protein [Paenibacillus rhizosphaerae]MBB3128833.1 hypothetical protein [Paenibacillus rhizosphaerae]